MIIISYYFLNPLIQPRNFIGRSQSSHILFILCMVSIVWYFLYLISTAFLLLNIASKRRYSKSNELIKYKSNEYSTDTKRVLLVI